MRSNSVDTNLSWSPSGWDEYAQWYPQTPRLPAAATKYSSEFSTIWKRHNADNAAAMQALRRQGNYLFVLVRGIFGNLMPGNFVALRDAFRAEDIPAVRPRTYVVGSVGRSAERLRRAVCRHVDRFDGVVWLCQSRGGLDVLHAITEHADLRRATAGVVLVQTPSAPSPVMQSVLTGCYRDSIGRRRTLLAEKVQKLAFGLPAFREGCAELISPRIERLVATFGQDAFDCPIVSVATWSIEPTSWVDSFHRRLGEIRPGYAHDGQFYVDDQCWPGADQLLLGRLDHAQTVMGGRGFDPVPFWSALAEMVLARAHASRSGRNSMPRTQTTSAA